MNADQQPARLCVVLVCFAGAQRASRGKSGREMRDLGLHGENGQSTQRQAQRGNSEASQDS
jgi:hypothetical protein